MKRTSMYEKINIEFIQLIVNADWDATTKSLDFARQLSFICSCVLHRIKNDHSNSNKRWLAVLKIILTTPAFSVNHEYLNDLLLNKIGILW